MLTLRTHDIMILGYHNSKLAYITGKLALGNFFWKWISLAEGENDEIIEMSVPNSCDKITIGQQQQKKTIKGRSFMSCLLNKSLKIKKEEKKVKLASSAEIS